MSEGVDVLAADWIRLRRSHPGVDDRSLGAEALSRGRRILEGPLEGSPPATLPASERLPPLRRRFARRAASISVYRLEYTRIRERLARATRREQETYEQHIELFKDLVPPLKEEAADLRAEVLRLEEEVRARGIDPETIEPRIDWPMTLAVDLHKRIKYETVEERRERTLDFFRRLGPR